MRNIKKLIDIVEEDKSYPFVAFKARHLNEEIEGIELYEEIYGKDKVRTLHVVLVLCLNLAVDPPDTLVKVSPCSKMEAWFDPKEKNLNRALEMIGKNLQIQYERWQPKARYRQSLDPTIEEIHRLCQSLRRSAREDRVLFHYNGHGVPRPTENGEIWVFNKAYTKYIPLSLYDLHSWMGGPTVYVFDCNNAGRIIRMMEQFSMKRFENDKNTKQNSFMKVKISKHVLVASGENGTANSSSMDNIIILASCQENEDIPQNPEVPADLFTSCLTTPIKIALHWYLLRNQEIFPNYLNETMLELIGGSPSNRVSMFGEINWVFTAVTDTIAWSCLPPPLFQKLFRQDLLVASLFRNFLLAERIMHYYGLRPVSYPPLPKTYEHPMWDAWDHALDCYTSQLPEIYHKKQSMNNSNNTENLLIIRHPSFDPLIVNNMSNNDSSEEDDDDIDEDEDMSTKDKIMQSTLDQQKNENTKGFNQTEKFQQERSQKQDLIQTAWNDALKQHNNTNVFNTRKPQILPNPRVLRQNSQSGKVFPISKTNNLNPLNGPICDLFPFKHTDFFNDHMTAFELWLKTADEKKPVPIQLPILLQVLLSQVHRYRALRLLSEYMDLGPWAVIQCLTVGIFPYVVRLLQSPVYDVKPYLVFIWGKIISSAQLVTSFYVTDFAKNDVVKDAGYKYFVSCLTENEPYEIIIKTISAFALAKMLNNNPVGQKLYIKQNFMTVLIEELENNPSDLANDNYIRLRIWFILSFAKLWSDNDDAKWYGVRQQIHEKLLLYLKDISPEFYTMHPFMLNDRKFKCTIVDNDHLYYSFECHINRELLAYTTLSRVRAATVYALGTFLNNKASDGIRSKHAVQVEQNICQHLLNHSVNDSSPLVRAELVVAMKYMVNLFSNQVMSMAIYYDVWLSQNNHGSINDVNNGKFMGPPSPLANRNVMPSRGSIEKISKRLFVHSPPALTDKISVRQKAVSSGDLTNFDENNNTFWLFKDSHIPFILPDMYLYGNINSTRGNLKNLGAELSFRPTFIKKVPAVSNFTTYNSGFPIINIYAQMWFSLILLSKDPYPKVSILASKIVEAINLYKKITQKSESNELNQQNTDFQISPKLNCSPAQFIQPIHSALFPSHNRKIDAISSFISTDTSSDKYLNSFEVIEAAERIGNRGASREYGLSEDNSAVSEAIIIKGFKKCCLSNAMDGSEDDIIWQDDISDVGNEEDDIDDISDNKFWNLGLCRIHGSMPAERCVILIENKLKEFANIVSITTDGASVMKKAVKLINENNQLCLAHIIQLAIIKVLYIKNNFDEIEDEHPELVELPDANDNGNPDKGNDEDNEDNDEELEIEGYQFDFKDVSTDFFNWSSKYFTLPLLPFHKLAHLSIPGTNFHNENIKSINSMQYLNQSKSFDKVSYKKLPNLIISESKSKSSARRLMHVIDSAKYEDRNERLKKQKNIKLEGAQNWKASLNSSGTQLSQYVEMYFWNHGSLKELSKLRKYSGTSVYKRLCLRTIRSYSFMLPSKSYSKRCKISIEKKKEIVKKHEMGICTTNISRDFNLPKSTLCGDSISELIIREKANQIYKDLFKQISEINGIDNLILSALNENCISKECCPNCHNSICYFVDGGNWDLFFSKHQAMMQKIFLQKIDSKPELLKFHPYLNYLAVVDRSGVSLWNWESGQRAQYMLSQSVSCKEETEIDSSSSETSGYITSLEFINAEEDRGGLILVGTMDGRIKIWRNYLRDMGQDPDIVTAWIALPDQICSNRPSGLITHWSQSLGQLTISGDVKYIRLWDSLQECKISDMNTNSESCVSSIDRSQDGRLIVAGFGDGHIKMFDIRAPVNECIYNSVINAGVGDMGWIHKVAYSDSTNQVYSIGIYGELTTWCVRQRNLPKPYITPSRRPNPLRNTQNVDIDPKATSREGLLKDPFTSDSKLTLAKSINHSLKLQPVHCADLRNTLYSRSQPLSKELNLVTCIIEIMTNSFQDNFVSSESDKEHLAVIGYGKESRGILTAIAPTGSINSNFKYFEGFSRANIEAPTSVCVHPYQTLVGAGLEDSSLLLLKLLPK
uniref:Raptor n=1 Tax=Schmidtea mediterranea TaxID=79327 RepID=H9XVZ5_SCHMD|nr:raptor [Schmidtea mediterranea]